MINWKTTLGAIVLGTLGILQTTLTAYQNGTPIQWLQVAMCIVVMALGLVMKDFDVTGNGKNATTATKATLVTLASIVLLAGCSSTQLVAATASNGDQFPYCLEQTFKLNPLQADTLFCAGLSTIQTEQAKQSALHPENTYTIVEQRKVIK
jgi:hypothetical protein